jgi:hypothetical protein
VQRSGEIKKRSKGGKQKEEGIGAFAPFPNLGLLHQVLALYECPELLGHFAWRDWTRAEDFADCSVLDTCEADGNAAEWFLNYHLHHLFFNWIPSKQRASPLPRKTKILTPPPFK